MPSGYGLRKDRSSPGVSVANHYGVWRNDARRTGFYSPLAVARAAPGAYNPRRPPAPAGLPPHALRGLMNIHEHQAKSVLSEFGVAVPRGYAAFSVDEAVKAAQDLGGPGFVVKTQIHAGGRGNGRF